MNMMDIVSFIKPYYRQSQGQAWLLAIVAVVGLFALTVVVQAYNTLDILSQTRSDRQVIGLQGVPEQSAYAQLSHAPLFGVSAQTTVSRVNTHYELLGVLLAINSNRSKAIIASQGKEAKSYGINDDLGDGGKLHKVYSDRVELKRNGQIETLPLKWDKRAVGGAVNSNGSRPSTTEGVVPGEAGAFIRQQEEAATSDVESQPQGDWQERIKEIREKYQQQFPATNDNNGINNGVVPSPSLPMKGLGGRYGRREGM